ncbi:MAG: DHCW motif cupin fold protein [Bacteroidia bacterium]
MKIESTIPFGITNWESLAEEKHPGISGHAIWKTVQLGEIRIRMVEYSGNYFADHWCDKGHVIYCISGEMTTELKDGQRFTLKEGMSYQVGDNSDSHRSWSENGVKLFIVD